MPFEEVNAQTALMNELSLMVERLRGLLSTNELLVSSRYSVPAGHLTRAVSSLVAAEDAIGFVPRLSD